MNAHDPFRVFDNVKPQADAGTIGLSLFDLATSTTKNDESRSRVQVRTNTSFVFFFFQVEELCLSLIECIETNPGRYENESLFSAKTKRKIRKISRQDIFFSKKFVALSLCCSKRERQTSYRASWTKRSVKSSIRSRKSWVTFTAIRSRRIARLRRRDR